MAGRIEAYLHSDASVQNKLGSLVEVTCDTDFAARTPVFTDFCKLVAMLACGYQTDSWNELCNLHLDLLEKKGKVEEELNEKIEVQQIVLMKPTIRGLDGAYLVRDRDNKVLALGNHNRVMRCVGG